MALLQLAEGYGMLAENELYLAETGTVSENYLFIPAGMFGMTEDTYVRSDFFDSLSDEEFNAVISALNPYQPQGLSAIGAITAVTAATKAIAPGIKKAIESRKEKVAAGTAKPIFKPGGKLSNLAGKIKAGVQKLKNVPTTKQDEIIEKTTPISGSIDVGGTSLDFSTGQPETESFFTKYKTPLIVGGVAIAGVLLYKVLNKK